MSLVKIKIIYDYYTTKRITPIFIREEDLINLCYEEFKTRLISEVPHLDKVGSSLRLTVFEDDVEVDLSPSYFNFQIKGLLEKEKTITVKAFTFDSPGLPSVPSQKSTSEKHRKIDFDTSQSHGQSTLPTIQQPRARRSIALSGSTNDQNELMYPDDMDDFEDDETFQPKGNNSRVMLPLERYAKKQQKAVDDIQRQLQIKKRELLICENKINTALQQNRAQVGNGNQVTCGNCHLKLGHTKKRCEYSPCKSAYSCGFTSKHGVEKMEITTLQREVAKLELSLIAARNEVQNAERVTEKVLSSASKQIEDCIVQEFPDRYTSFGRRNWAVFNKDVALLQKNLQGRLPSRENVMALVHSVVFNSSTDHRMSSQKRLLSNEYGIVFPTDTSKTKEKKLKLGFSSSVASTHTIVKPNSSSNCSSGVANASFFSASHQETQDLKLALKLQKEEMESESMGQCTVADSDFNNQAEDQATAKDVPVIANADLELFEANAAAALLQLQQRKGH